MFNLLRGHFLWLANATNNMYSFLQGSSTACWPCDILKCLFISVCTVFGLNISVLCVGKHPSHLMEESFTSKIENSFLMPLVVNRMYILPVRFLKQSAGHEVSLMRFIISTCFLNALSIVCDLILPYSATQSLTTNSCLQSYLDNWWGSSHCSETLQSTDTQIFLSWE